MKVYKGDTGTQIIIGMGTDLTTATGLLLTVKKPSGTVVSWTPTKYDTDKLKYVVQAGDLNESGTYWIQPQMTLSGWTGSGEEKSFKVDTTIGDY